MSKPFQPRTIDAVGACTRALAGWADVEALVAEADAATLGGLRAFADRLALRRRFHDPSIHADGRPAGQAAGAVFDALEAARLDALGARWLAGIARNLTAHPGADQDGLRWLAFASLGGGSVPPSKAALAGDVRGRLPAALLDEIARLSDHLGDQGVFAQQAARWSERAAPHLPPPTDAPAPAKPPALRARTIHRQLPTRGDPGATRAPLASRRRDATDTGPDGAGSGGRIERGGTPSGGYRAYTTAHDRVVHASSLATRAELEALRVALATELGSVRAIVARLAKRLLRVLMARQVREWRFDLDEGMLDGSRLAALVASGGRARPFKQEQESRFPGTVVTLLIDHSGSMRGRPMRIAALTVEIFARVLERCGVRCEVLGFTTREWDGGEPAREWAARGYPPEPGRLNALEHVVIKGADVPWRRARAGLGLFLHDEMLKENIDGEALAWAHARLLARAEARRILVVVSDGTPMDEATMAANGHEYLEQHLQEVIEQIESRSPVHLAAIGIGHDVSAFYRNATRIARIDDLGPALTQKLMTLLAAP
jgi:cobaltochelatase CobT